jgi:hypothetical protein
MFHLIPSNSVRSPQLFVLFLLLEVFIGVAATVPPPVGLVSRGGDRSIVLHWDDRPEAEIAGYRVYRATNVNGPFVALGPSLLGSRGYCDLSTNVLNGRTNFYRVTAMSKTAVESPPSPVEAVAPREFTSDEEFLEYLQQVHFDYFWYLANPKNGLIPDRTAAGSACSIAAVGFGLTAIGIGIDHGWIRREEGAARVLTALKTFWSGPQGSQASGVMGYKGWFYHFLNMNTGFTTGAELSSIDTALLMAGILYAKQYFDGAGNEETEIRSVADAVFKRVDWQWMARDSDALSMGWSPESGFIPSNWIGYNEAMVLYCLGLGAAGDPLPATAWSAWTNAYKWATYYGQSFVPFPPLFGHQYSHCWIDFRQITDGYMASHHLTYFENSRRATLAQREYCLANPQHRVGYSKTVWGLTASDGPSGYSARGAPPAENDDGTISPTAAGGSIAFAPEVCVPTLRYLYNTYRTQIWTAYGFRDAMNLEKQWFGPDELGIDQGPIVIMIENYRTGRVWRRFMKNLEVQRGLQRAGFSR